MLDYTYLFFHLGGYRKLLVVERRKVFFKKLASMPGFVVSGGYKRQVISLSSGN